MVVTIFQAKYKDWKNYLKSAYDQFHGQYHFLI